MAAEGSGSPEAPSSSTPRGVIPPPRYAAIGALDRSSGEVPTAAALISAAVLISAVSHRRRHLRQRDDQHSGCPDAETRILWPERAPGETRSTLPSATRRTRHRREGQRAQDPPPSGKEDPDEMWRCSDAGRRGLPVPVELLDTASQRLLAELAPFATQDLRTAGLRRQVAAGTHPGHRRVCPPHGVPAAMARRHESRALPPGEGAMAARCQRTATGTADHRVRVRQDAVRRADSRTPPAVVAAVGVDPEHRGAARIFLRTVDGSCRTALLAGAAVDATGRKDGEAHGGGPSPGPGGRAGAPLVTSGQRLPPQERSIISIISLDVDFTTRIF